MNSKKVPTYGAVVSSMEYEERIRRRRWFKHNKNKIIIGCAILLAAAALVISMAALA